MDDKGLTNDINKFFNRHASFDAAHRKFFARDMALDQAALDWTIDGFFHGDNDNDETAVDAAIHQFFARDADPDWKEEEHPRDKGGKFTEGAGEAAIPPPPQIKSTQAANLGKQKHLDALHKFAQAGEWDKVEAYPTPGVNTYAKMVQKYKASLLALKGKAPAAPTPAAKKETFSEVGKSIPEAMQMYKDMLLKDFSGITEGTWTVGGGKYYNDPDLDKLIHIAPPMAVGGNATWHIGQMEGKGIADLKKELTKLKAAKPAPKEEPKALEIPQGVGEATHNALASMGYPHKSTGFTGTQYYENPEAGIGISINPGEAGWNVFKVAPEGPQYITNIQGSVAGLSNQLKEIQEKQGKPVAEPTPAAAPTPTGAKEPGKTVPSLVHNMLSGNDYTVGHVSTLTGVTEYTKPDGSTVVVKSDGKWEYIDKYGEEMEGGGYSGLVDAIHAAEPAKPVAAKPAEPPKPAAPPKPPEPPKPAAPPAPEGFEPATTPGTIVKASYSEPLTEKGFKVTHTKPDGSTIYTHPDGSKVQFDPPTPGHTSLPWEYTDKQGKKQTGTGSSALVNKLPATPAQTYIGAGSKKPPPLQSEYGKAKYEDAFGNVLEAIREADTTKIPGNFYAEAVTALGDDPHNADTTAVTSVMQKLHYHYKQDMTSGQISAITDYQGSGSGAINSYLRGATSESSVSPSTKTKVNAIRKAMANSYIPVRMYMARGMHNSIAEITGFSDPDEAVGRVFVHRNFASFSRSESTAKSFAGMTGTVLHCVFPPGCRGVVVDKQSWEDETIFPDHTVFRVDKITKGDAGDKRSHIYCSWLGVTTMEQTSKGVSEV